MAVLRPRRVVRGGRLDRHLPDRFAGAGRVPDQRLRRQILVRGGRGAARQDPGRARAYAGLAQDRRVRHGGPARLLRSASHVARGAERSGPRTCPRAPDGMGEAHRHPQGRRRGDHRLHLGNDGPVQGRHAHPSQHHLPDGRLQAHRPAARRDRRGAELPAAVPRRRALRRLLQPHRRHAHRQFRGSARHRAAELARGGAAHLPGRAAGVGEALFGHHHPDQGRHAPRPSRLQGGDRHRL